jgi:hypothetical protein
MAECSDERSGETIDDNKRSEKDRSMQKTLKFDLHQAV